MSTDADMDLDREIRDALRSFAPDRETKERMRAFLAKAQAEHEGRTAGASAPFRAVGVSRASAEAIGPAVPALSAASRTKTAHPTRRSAHGQQPAERKRRSFSVVRYLVPAAACLVLLAGACMIALQGTGGTEGMARSMQTIFADDSRAQGDGTFTDGVSDMPAASQDPSAAVNAAGEDPAAAADVPGAAVVQDPSTDVTYHDPAAPAETVSFDQCDNAVLKPATSSNDVSIKFVTDADQHVEADTSKIGAFIGYAYAFSGGGTAAGLFGSACAVYEYEDEDGTKLAIQNPETGSFVVAETGDGSTLEPEGGSQVQETESQEVGGLLSEEPAVKTETAPMPETAGSAEAL